MIAASAIAIAGTRLASVADRLADRSGLGEAVTGTIFLGLTTALPGVAASVTAALDGRPVIAVSNALGGILGVPPRPWRMSLSQQPNRRA